MNLSTLNRRPPKIEVGVLISGLAGGRVGDQGNVGGGGRVTFNLTKALALEGELITSRPQGLITFVYSKASSE